MQLPATGRRRSAKEEAGLALASPAEEMGSLAGGQEEKKCCELLLDELMLVV